MKHAAILLFLLLPLVSCQTPKKFQPINIPVVYENKEYYQNVKRHPFTVKCKTEYVPKGFLYDGASVPRIVWSFMPPDGLHRSGALIHDWCYINQGRLKYNTITKDEADQLFYDHMVFEGVGKIRAWIAYKAVNSFGHKAWKNKEEIIILPLLK